MFDSQVAVLRVTALSHAGRATCQRPSGWPTTVRRARDQARAMLAAESSPTYHADDPGAAPGMRHSEAGAAPGMRHSDAEQERISRDGGHAQHHDGGVSSQLSDPGHTPAGALGRAAVAELSQTPGSSALAAAVGQLADAVDALARVDPADEHIDDLGAASLAIEHLQTRLDAALLTVVGSFDRQQGYRNDGSVTCASWLRRRTNCDHGRATGLVQAAQRLPGLPLLATHLAAGDVTLAHVTAITKAAVPQRAAAVAQAEPALTQLAITNPPQDVRRAVRRLADITDRDGSDPPPDPASGGDPLRQLTLRTGYQGRGDLDATLDPLTREALTVLLDAFDTPDPSDTPPDQRRSPAQRRHDAFAAMLHTLTAQPDLPTTQGARPQILITIDLASLLGLPPDHPAADTTLADLAAALGINPTQLGLPPTNHAGDQPEQDTRPTSDQPEQNTRPTSDQPEQDARPTGDPVADRRRAGDAHPPPRPARYGSGTQIDPAAVRGLLPNATIMAVLTLGPWRAVNVGARHRTLPAWLRAVLTSIHRHCRGPDCDRPANWTQAHHITPWNKTATTDLNDTLPLCTAHHDLITTHNWHATLNHTTGTTTWTSPQNRTIRVPPPEP